jgi:hypothetical protein
MQGPRRSDPLNHQRANERLHKSPSPAILRKINNALTSPLPLPAHRLTLLPLKPNPPAKPAQPRLRPRNPGCPRQLQFPGLVRAGAGGIQVEDLFGFGGCCDRSQRGWKVFGGFDFGGGRRCGLGCGVCYGQGWAGFGLRGGYRRALRPHKHGAATNLPALQHPIPRIIQPVLQPNPRNRSPPNPSPLNQSRKPAGQKIGGPAKGGPAKRPVLLGGGGKRGGFEKGAGVCRGGHDEKSMNCDQLLDE